MTITSGTRRIHVLPGEVVSRIAAGEVIERPAAVIKELIDNSVDAGSSTIKVDVTDGGRGRITVTDDGDGMSSVDAPLAFQRHATSKLQTEGDLAAIATLGFRGEALPSIASVSKVRVLTASRTESFGTELFLAGGVLIRQEEAAAVPGTQVEVADLFFNTPARKKFLKTTPTEFSHICQIVQQAALAWPNIHFRLRHNGQAVFEYPSVPSPRDRILQIYGTRLLEQMADVGAAASGVQVEGLAVKALHARATRSPQELFVNRRPVKNATIAHAVYEGYGSTLAKGSHPIYVLFLDVDCTLVDVNVHPAKREVRFADQELIHRTVGQAVRTAVRVDHSAGQAAIAGDLEPRQSTATTVSARNEAQDSGGTFASFPWPQTDGRGEALSLWVREASSIYAGDHGDDVVPLGQVNQTFLIAQVGTELHVIDQHTAHERIVFERLWKAWTTDSVAIQPLLIPESIEVPPHAAPLLRQYLGDLAKLGLDIEPFGGMSFVVRAVPALLGHVDYAGLVHDLIEDLAQWNSTTSLEARVRPVLASLACHAAVRAGRPMQAPEMKRLIDEWVQEGQPATCPHGRRIALRFTAEELAKIFGR